MSAIIEVLTPAEQAKHAEREAIIERGKQSFIEVGLALCGIRDDRSYRPTHGTFEAYCRERWGWERRHAYRLIDAATAAENVSNWTQKKPATESQARPLAKLEPAQQMEAWGMATESAHAKGKAVTAKDVEDAVKEVKKPARETLARAEVQVETWIPSSEFYAAKDAFSVLCISEKHKFIQWVLNEVGAKR